MSFISKRKCKSFQSHLQYYKKKSHLSYNELTHLMYLTPLHNYFEPSSAAYEMPNIVKTNVEKKITQPIVINTPLNSVSDILSLLDTIDISANYSIDMQLLNKIRPELEELNAMIGMKSLKAAILDQLLYYIQGFDGCAGFKHTVLYGSPGTGKTEVAKIIGKMYSKLGVLKKPTIEPVKSTPANEALASLFSCKPVQTVGTTAFKKVTRADLVAGYVGQTALKTKAIIQECLGGVIFLDEAYSLGGKDDGDTFSKECVDTLCEALSNYRENLMFIIAGYEKELDANFFSMNPGLNSRFVWRFKIDDYSATDLFDIFVSMVKKDVQWRLDANLESSGKDWFKQHFSKFPNFGRDVDTFLFKTKIAHSRRVYCLTSGDKGLLTLVDLNAGLKAFYIKSNDDSKKLLYNSLYS